MKKLIRILSLTLAIILLLSAIVFSSNASEEIITQDPQLNEAIQWLENGLNNNNFYSFNYNGVAFAEIVSGWSKHIDKKETSKEVIYTLSMTSPDNVLLTGTFTINKEYASIEYVFNFKNNAQVDSPVISDILPLDCNFDLGDATVYTAKGCCTDSNHYDDFTPIEKDISKHALNVHTEGKSSYDAFPYFALSDGNDGIVGGIGWTGGWKAKFSRKDGLTNIYAGMNNTKISLHADEEMRTPAIMIMFFTGDGDDGCNKLRQLILSNYTPEDKDGNVLTELVNTIDAFDAEKGVVRVMKQLLSRLNDILDLDLYWIDAGYYCNPGETWNSGLGNFYPTANSGITSGSFANISDACHDADMELMVWIEPERAATGTLLPSLYPEYYMPSFYENTLYYRMQDDDACEYMTNLVSKFIKDNKIDWYRQDSNIHPEMAWASCDKIEGTNRTGITEIKYITNLYKFMDYLLEDNPGLVIDNCATGGRRLDFEMMKRSVPLWRSDLCWNPDGARTINYSLSKWLPLSGGHCDVTQRSTYVGRCVFCAAKYMSMKYFIGSTNFDYYSYEEAMNNRKYILGDYYLLTQGTYTKKTEEFAAYEYYLPDEKDGFVNVFRPANCTESSINVKLKGLDRNTVYTVYVADTEDTFLALGSTLLDEGLDITIDNPYTSLQIRFFAN